jgi:hypothetical protein
MTAIVVCLTPKSRLGSPVEAIKTDFMDVIGNYGIVEAPTVGSDRPGFVKSNFVAALSVD